MTAVYRIAGRLVEIAALHPDVHALCAAYRAERAAYLFAAESGTGKSTHARLWRELLGGRALMVNDDKPLLRVTEGGVLACGTPWDGKHRLILIFNKPL